MGEPMSVTFEWANAASDTDHDETPTRLYEEQMNLRSPSRSVCGVLGGGPAGGGPAGRASPGHHGSPAAPARSTASAAAMKPSVSRRMYT